MSRQISLETFKVEIGSINGEPYYAIGGTIEGEQAITTLWDSFILQIPEWMYTHLEESGVDVSSVLKQVAVKGGSDE